MFGADDDGCDETPQADACRATSTRCGWAAALAAACSGDVGDADGGAGCNGSAAMVVVGGSGLDEMAGALACDCCGSRFASSFVDASDPGDGACTADDTSADGSDCVVRVSDVNAVCGLAATGGDCGFGDVVVGVSSLRVASAS